MDERIILHVDMDAFFASVEELCNPAIRGKPVMVTGIRATRTVVAAASYEARKYGIKAGTPITKARELCPNGVFLEGDPHKYVYASRKMNEACAEFSPVVERYSIDESFLDISGTAKFFGGALETGRRLKQRVKDQFGLTISAGIGPNKLVAKMASKLEKPDGLTLLTLETFRERIHPLPVRKMFGVGGQLEERLGQLGVTTIGELAIIPPDVMERLFGVYGVWLHEASNGRDDAPVVADTDVPPAKSTGNSYTLLEDSDDNDHLLKVLFALSAKVGRRLREAGQRGRTVSMTLRLHDFTTITRAKTLPVHIDRDTAIFEAAKEIFLRERAKPKYSVPIRLLGVTVSGLDVARQDWLICRDENLRYDGMLRIADTIKDKYGDSVLTWARLVHPRKNPQMRSHNLAGMSWEKKPQKAKKPETYESFSIGFANRNGRHK